MEIVFEDIDRFDTGLVFQRLRDINKLANSKNIKRKIRFKKQKTLKFIYLVRDDIFSYEDRIKFFDMIIPVVPKV